MFYFFISLGSALALFVLMLKIGLKKVLGYDVYVDIFCTLFLMFIFQSTVTGMIAAVIGGLFLSILLMFCKFLIGYSRYEEVPGEDDMQWVSYPPPWKRK